MLAVIAPYELTDRSPAAITALLLADPLVTLAPAPDEPHQSRAADALAHAWAWTRSLWAAGVLTHRTPHADPRDDLAVAAQRLRQDPHLAALRAMLTTRADHATDPDRLLVDVARGGRDAASTLLVTHALERFAARNAAALFQAPARSLAARARTPARRPAARLLLRVPTRVDAADILTLREHLAQPLASLRASLAGASPHQPAQNVAQAVNDYDRALPDALDALEEHDLALRVVSVQLEAQAPDACYRAAARVAGRLAKPAARGTPRTEATPAEPLPALPPMLAATVRETRFSATPEA